MTSTRKKMSSGGGTSPGAEDRTRLRVKPRVFAWARTVCADESHHPWDRSDRVLSPQTGLGCYFNCMPVERAAKNMPSPMLAPKRFASRRPRFSRWV